MKRFAFLLCLSLLCGLSQNSLACTLWALNGPDVRGGGTLVAKNRDFSIETPNTLEVVTPASGYKMLSLVAINPEGKRSLVGGVNEHGFSVMTATPDTMPKAERIAVTKENGLKNPTRALLTNCKSVDEALADKDLLRSLYPVFAILADKDRVVMLETSGGDFRLLPMQAGQQAVHTNHPLSKDLLALWEKPAGPGSLTRHARMSNLLLSVPKPANLQEFFALGNDEHDGPDASIFRTGSGPGKPRTLATMAVLLPKKGPVVATVRLTNPDSPSILLTLKLDAAFWQNMPKPGHTRELAH